LPGISFQEMILFLIIHFPKKIKYIFCNSCPIVNLETPLTDRGNPILETVKNYRASSQYAKILKSSGVDCVT